MFCVARTQVGQVNSPRKLDMIMESLRSLDSSSPRPLLPRESGTTVVSQGLTTCSEETTEKSFEADLPLVQDGDFSSLKFDDAVEAISTEASNTIKVEAVQSVPSFMHYPERPQSDAAKSQQQTFGYQQRMKFSALEPGFGGAQHKISRHAKKRKKRAQNPYFQQQERRVQGEFNFDHSNAKAPTNFGQQQGMSQWGIPPPQPVAAAPQNYQGMQYFPGPVRDQASQPQNVATANFAGNFSSQVPPIPNFSVPPPNIPPAEFFRKVPPPNFQQQSQPVLPQTPQNVPLPSQPIPPPPLPGNQPGFFSPVQPSPFGRLPPAPPHPFQTGVSAAPPAHFTQSVSVPPPQNVLPSFPAQQTQFPSFKSPPPPLLQGSILPAQPVGLVAKPPAALPPSSSGTHSLPPSVAESLSPQARTVTSASAQRCEVTESTPFGSEPSTPSPVKHKPMHLPPHWKTATDPQGKVYYYHAITR